MGLSGIKITEEDSVPSRRLLKAMTTNGGKTTYCFHHVECQRIHYYDKEGDE